MNNLADCLFNKITKQQVFAILLIGMLKLEHRKVYF